MRSQKAVITDFKSKLFKPIGYDANSGILPYKYKNTAAAHFLKSILSKCHDILAIAYTF